jgi:arylsulfatase A-like enzyme
VWFVLAAATLAACAGDRRPDPHPAPAAPAVDLVAAFPFTGSGPRTTTIDLGHPSARRHLVSGWSAPASLPDGSTGAAATRAVAVVSFDAGREPVEQRLVVAAGAPPGRRIPQVWIELNRVRLGRIRLGEGIAEHEVAVPTRAQRPGRNLLRLRHFGAVPRGQSERAPALAFYRALRFESAAPDLPSAHVDGDSPRLLIPPGAEATYHFRAPPDARLTFGVDAGETRTGRGLRVTVRADGGAERVVIPADRELGAATDARLGLAPGEVARLTLAVPTTAAPGSETVALLRPAIAGRQVTGAPRVPVDGPRAPPPPARRPNVLLYVADTLRADRLGCYGYQRPTSPHLDRLAAGGILFERAIAQSSWTRPATGSILTGHYPSVHGAVTLRDGLGSATVTLAEALGDAGYTTGGFVTNLNVADSLGFGRGFATYRYLPEDRKRPSLYATAEELHAAALPWIEAHRDEPFFLYLHASDPHAPYRPPPAYAERFALPDIRPTIGARTPMRRLLERPGLATPDNVAYLSALYDAEVAALDATFGALLERLSALGLDANLLLIFVADHGEEFHDHGSFDHGRTLYQEVVRVPLIVRLPAHGRHWLDRLRAGLFGGRRIGAVVRQVDILPTILTLTGTPLPPGLPGRPLPGVAATADDPGPDEAFAETHLSRRGLTALVTARWKAIAADAGEGLELYDLADDPGERHDRAGAHPVLAGYARQHLEELGAARAGSGTAGAPPRLHPDVLERLRALGYVNQ